MEKRKRRRGHFVGIIAFAVAAGAARVVLAEEHPLSDILITAPRADDDYSWSQLRVGPGRRLALETPANVTVVGRSILDDQRARTIADVITNDASATENYAPLGYYENISLRGFVLDTASGYKRNGLTVAGEASMPLENKERIEILKGVAGLEAGLAAPGGLVNYVTKLPPENVKRSVSLELSERGTRYAALDVGGRLGSGGWLGYRINAAHEAYHPYVKEAVGQRNFFSGVMDVRLSEHSLIVIDMDWQRKSQLSVPAYQPLGGNALPPNVDPEKMLNNQSWSLPVVISASDLGGRFEYKADPGWSFSLAGNYNRVASDDNAAFPYGCSSGPAYSTTFCSNGDYDLYDYRSPGEIHTAAHVQAVVNASVGTESVKHDVMVGAGRFDREVHRGQELYDYVGTDNIYNPAPKTFPASTNLPGTVYLTQKYIENSLFMQDTVSVAEFWTVHAGLRWVSFANDLYGRQNGQGISRDVRSVFAPLSAIVYKPHPEIAAYVSYSEGLELGSTAGTTAANAGQTLAPKVGKQIEVGVKREYNNRLSVNLAAFQVSKPYEFIDLTNTLVQRGRQKHSGIELSGAGRMSEQWRVLASMSLINAKQLNTGVDAFDGKAPVNVAWLRSTAGVDYVWRGLPGLGANATWGYVSRRYAVRDNTLAVPAYHRFDAGLRYATTIWRGRLVWRARVENVLDKTYWRDVGQAFGDGYLHLGAPRTYSLSAQLNF